eukprot:8351440-Ditylum_brightwellii.AAC.1
MVSSIIQKKIKNHTTTESWRRLELQKEKFEWTKADSSKVIDRPTLALVILTYVKPSSNVDVDKEVKLIKTATMVAYNHDPMKLKEEMELNFNKIVAVSQEKVFTEHNFTRHIFRALCTASNLDCLHYIKAKKNLFNKGKAIVMSVLMADIRKQYANNKEEYDCRDPKDNAILALTTKLTHLESKLKESQFSGGGGRKEGACGHGGNKNGGGNDLPKWHTVKKDNEVTQGGQKWEWCPDHHKEGKYDGIYMPVSHNHTEWLEKVKACAEFCKKKKEEKEASKSTPKSSTSGPKLILMDNLKT